MLDCKQSLHKFQENYKLLQFYKNLIIILWISVSNFLIYKLRNYRSNDLKTKNLGKFKLKRNKQEVIYKQKYIKLAKK